MDGGGIMNIRDLAADVAQKLVEAGFVVHRYNAYSTQSVYLKLDYGVANSIRISDHKGKKKLSYRYNIMVGEKAYRKDTKGKYPRYYYPAEKVDELLRRIEMERKMKITSMGQDRYKALMKQYEIEGKSSPGFWQKAKKVNLRRSEDAITRIEGTHHKA